MATFVQVSAQRPAIFRVLEGDAYPRVRVRTCVIAAFQFVSSKEAPLRRRFCMLQKLKR